jgi:murein DD-endopeptidase MepM/ murein hydrolase activator NlpD
LREGKEEAITGQEENGSAVLSSAMESRTGKLKGAGGWLALAFVCFLLALLLDAAFRLGPELLERRKFDSHFAIVSPIDLASLPVATRFDFPIGSEHGAMTYNAQPFTENMHLGDDLNGIGGENSDLGDPVFAVAEGRVLAAREGGPGWGNVIIVLHAYNESGERKYVQSFYGHVQTILIAPREMVRRGQQIATIGTGGGKYWAHLHFEMREFTTPFIGAGYRKDTRGWINPSAFIETHRGAPNDDVGRPSR